jgi:dihydrofolate synthase/folylpolyglutamate synthase
VTVGDPKAALERARELAGPGGAVLATGSIYLIADLVREPGMARASMI